MWGVREGVRCKTFSFCSLFPVQKTTREIGHRVRWFFRVDNQYAKCEKQQQTTASTLHGYICKDTSCPCSADHEQVWHTARFICTLLYVSDDHRYYTYTHIISSSTCLLCQRAKLITKSLWSILNGTFFSCLDVFSPLLDYPVVIMSILWQFEQLFYSYLSRRISEPKSADFWWSTSSDHLKKCKTLRYLRVRILIGSRVYTSSTVSSSQGVWRG